MTDIATQEVAAAARPRPAGEDLSAELQRSVERRADERVRAVRVFGDCYRCNWWVRDAGPLLAGLPAATVRRSRLLRATRTADGLVVEDVTGPRTGGRAGDPGSQPAPAHSPLTVARSGAGPTRG